MSAETMGTRRYAEVTRNTKETQVQVAIEIGSAETSSFDSPVGFLNHMMELLCYHALLHTSIVARGDMHVDAHHVCEDIGIAFGQALSRALGDRRGICRYGEVHLPMDETLVRLSLDFSGRPFLHFGIDFFRDKIGVFDTDLVREWFRAFTQHAGVTLHIDAIRGDNAHHLAEAAFKALGRAIRQAVSSDPRRKSQIPSTKGILES